MTPGRPGGPPQRVARRGVPAAAPGPPGGPLEFVSHGVNGWICDPEPSALADAFAEGARRHALQRGGQPSEVVGAALYLASDAASYTSGATLRVDGGIP